MVLCGRGSERSGELVVAVLGVVAVVIVVVLVLVVVLQY